MVRAKFRVRAIERIEGTPAEQQTVKLTAVYGDKNPENKEFWKYTPSGDITLSVIKPEVGNYFELGKEYYVDFTKYEPAALEAEPLPEVAKS